MYYVYSLILPILLLMYVILSVSGEQPVKELKAKPCDSQTSSRTECLQWFNVRQHNGFRSVTMGHLELMDFFEALVIHEEALNIFMCGVI